MSKNKILAILLVILCCFLVALWKTDIFNFSNEKSNINNIEVTDNSKDSHTEKNNTHKDNEYEQPKNSEQKDNNSEKQDKEDTKNSESTSEKNNNATLNNNETEKNILDISYQTQKEWNYCAPTTVSMMLSAKGKQVDQYTLAKEMGTYEPFGTHNKDAVRILNKYMFGYEYPQGNQAGYRMEFVTNVSHETLKTFNERVIKNIKDGYPMYLTFDSSKIYPGKKGEHNVILVGYKIENSNFFIYYLDPSPNVKDPVYGGLKILSSEELLTAMLTCEEPNYAW